MAIVACPECKGQVSSAAAACPHCGHPMGPGAAMMPPAALGRAGGAEETLWEGSPSLKSQSWSIGSTALFAMVLAAGMVLTYRPTLRLVAGLSDTFAEVIAADEPVLRLATVGFVVVVAGARVARLLWRIVALRSQRYRLTNQRLLIERGVLSKTIVEIDLRTVDEILFHQSVFERLLGLGEIVVVSSEPGRRGTSERVGLAGIVNPRDVREKIRGAAYQATGNQVFMRAT